MNERIWLSLAEMGGREQEFIQSAFDTNWVVPLGPNVDGFEEDLVRFLGIEGHRVVALSAGTAAELYLCGKCQSDCVPGCYPHICG